MEHLTNDIFLLKKEIISMLTGNDTFHYTRIFDCKPNGEKALIQENRHFGEEDIEIDIIYTREQVKELS